MSTFAPPEDRAAARETAALAVEDLRAVVARAARLLPQQGPIGLFVHNNTLAALEDLPFEEAVREGARRIGAEPYWPEDRYRQLLRRGRITVDDLASTLVEDLGDEGDRLVGLFGTRFHLRLAMLGCPLDDADHAELRWWVAESDALQKFRDDTPPAVRREMIDDARRWMLRDLYRTRRVDGGATTRRRQTTVDETPEAALANLLLAGVVEHFGADKIESWSEQTWESFCLHALWRVCYHGVRYVWDDEEQPPERRRHRDAVQDACGFDTDVAVHELLIRFCAAYLDQGQAEWALPERDRGFWSCFQALYGQPGGPPQPWLRELAGELQRVGREGQSAWESLGESLDVLGVAGEEREAYLAATLLALRGWAGMIWQLETRSDRVAHPAAADSLAGFLAARLLLERLALARAASAQLGYRGPLAQLRAAATPRPTYDRAQRIEQRALAVYQLAQALGWKTSVLYRLSEAQWNALVSEVEAFGSLERRRIFQRAFERRFRRRALTAIAQRAALPLAAPAAPRLQVICCLDDREESLRRHLEELDGNVETFGSAGFFAVAMYYRGAADADFIPLCPVVIRPAHYVEETVDRRLAAVHRRHGALRRLLGAAAAAVQRGSRTFTGGALLSATLGPLATAPLVARVIAPRLTSLLRRQAGRWVQPPQATQLKLERQPDNAGDRPGYTIDEMTSVVERLLRDIGLTQRFARLVLVLGHGSASMNNPHKAAYHCAACGGAQGGPNARALAQMANDPRVRRRLAQRGIDLPAETWFVAGLHNTCDEQLTLFDLERLPAWLEGDLNAAADILAQARQRNAHERCRRFEAAPLDVAPEAALRHVESRAEDLAQTRAEIGHATNALCFVGRRARTRGLFLDRRAFLVSYDPQHDDVPRTILTRILQAVVPVCGGISLDYYFSCLDPVGWGSGTKLPHNIASLLGVMDGAASDLRTGLPAQMTELHEPMRLLFVIEAAPADLLRIIEAQPAIGRLVRNGWVQLATLNPDSPQVHLYKEGEFAPWQPSAVPLAQVAQSQAWYRGWRDHLDFALVAQPNDAASEARA